MVPSGRSSWPPCTPTGCNPVSTGTPPSRTNATASSNTGRSRCSLLWPTSHSITTDRQLVAGSSVWTFRRTNCFAITANTRVITSLYGFTTSAISPSSPFAHKTILARVICSTGRSMLGRLRTGNRTAHDPNNRLLYYSNSSNCNVSGSCRGPRGSWLKRCTTSVFSLGVGCNWTSFPTEGIDGSASYATAPVVKVLQGLLVSSNLIGRERAAGAKQLL